MGEALIRGGAGVKGTTNRQPLCPVRIIRTVRTSSSLCDCVTSMHCRRAGEISSVVREDFKISSYQNTHPTSNNPIDTQIIIHFLQTLLVLPLLQGIQRNEPPARGLRSILTEQALRNMPHVVPRIPMPLPHHLPNTTTHLIRLQLLRQKLLQTSRGNRARHLLSHNCCIH